MGNIVQLFTFMIIGITLINVIGLMIESAVVSPMIGTLLGVIVLVCTFSLIGVIGSEMHK